MAKYKIPIFKNNPPTANDCYEKLSEMSYQSPIEVMIGQMRFEQEKRVEGEVFKATQEVGVTVDKDELIKALRYDRDQYRKGFVDGCRADTDKLCQEVKADTVRKMQERLKAESITIQDHTGKLGSVVLIGTIDQIAKEMVEGDLHTKSEN